MTVALVTGAASGIGRASAEALQRAGVRVLKLDLKGEIAYDLRELAGIPKLVESVLGVDEKLGFGLGEVHRRLKRKAGSEGEFRPGDIAIWGLLTKRVHSQEECSSSAVPGIRDKWLI